MLLLEQPGERIKPCCLRGAYFRKPGEVSFKKSKKRYRGFHNADRENKQSMIELPENRNLKMQSCVLVFRAIYLDKITINICYFLCIINKNFLTTKKRLTKYLKICYNEYIFGGNV